MVEIVINAIWRYFTDRIKWPESRLYAAAVRRRQAKNSGAVVGDQLLFEIGRLGQTRDRFENQTSSTSTTGLRTTAMRRGC
jgi:hypothetical protein